MQVIFQHLQYFPIQMSSLTDSLKAFQLLVYFFRKDAQRSMQEKFLFALFWRANWK